MGTQIIGNKLTVPYVLNGDNKTRIRGKKQLASYVFRNHDRFFGRGSPLFNNHCKFELDEIAFHAPRMYRIVIDWIYPHTQDTSGRRIISRIPPQKGIFLTQTNSQPVSLPLIIPMILCRFYAFRIWVNFGLPFQGAKVVGIVVRGSVMSSWVGWHPKLPFRETNSSHMEVSLIFPSKYPSI